MASQAQILANKQNAQLSTGPKTDAGKAKSKLNAFRHGLTSETIVLSADDMQAYQEFSVALLSQLQPAGPLEQQYAQTIVDTHWRLHKIPALEANLFALARIEPAPEHIAALADSPAKCALLEANALVVHERQFRNLHLQEQRLNRALSHVTKEFASLQEQRFLQEQNQKSRAASYPKHTHAEPLAQPVGSVISEPESAPQPPDQPSRSSIKAAAA